MMKALVKFLGRNDMTAYLVMMANRLVGTPPRPQADREPVPALRSDGASTMRDQIVLDAVLRCGELTGMKYELDSASNPKSLWLH